MVEAESEETVRLQSKASEMLESPSSIALPASKEPEFSCFHIKSLAEMVNEDSIRLQNRSCVIREEIVKIRDGERCVYSSLACLPTFSIGLSSNHGEAPPRASACKSRVDIKEKNSPRYFQMPELSARIFVGDVDGCDTVTCHLIRGYCDTVTCHLIRGYCDISSALHLDSEYAAVRSFYEDDCPGGLNSRLRGLESKGYFDVILSGTELVIASPNPWDVAIVVGNLRRKGSSVFASSSDYKDRMGDKTNRQPSDIVEQLGDTVPSVSYVGGMDQWKSVKQPYLLRLRGSELKKPKKPKFMKKFGYSKKNPLKKHGLKLTRFDDFVIVGNENSDLCLHREEIIDIVRKNAFKTVDVIAAQLVKRMIEKNPYSRVTIIVIFLDHKEISLREHEKKKKRMWQKITKLCLGDYWDWREFHNQRY